MGISDGFHFSWLREAVRPNYQQIRSQLPHKPRVLGIAESRPSPFLEHLLANREYDYLACDLNPGNSAAMPCDLNNLRSLKERIRADIVCCFRASYFIEDKHAFLGQLVDLLSPGAFLFIDFLIGSSDLPVLDFRYGDQVAQFASGSSRPATFKTTFFDPLLLADFPEEVDAFCRDARRWPLQTQWGYLKRFPRQFWKDSRSLKDLQPKNLGEMLRSVRPEPNLVSVADLEQNGFEIQAFSARYFYPQVKKFNLYNFVAARYAGGVGHQERIPVALQSSSDRGIAQG